ncbi:hypothetical protein QC820_15760 [Halomonas mongoliensis]|uniref:Uncharacterized protein n=1 Tax=Halomonas mongoliensis TaxID=321265 RepID=A0ABU1GQD0_9GAMM|nr:hypothetical protein [Halomonas mongoliensis]MDR5894245.1 hypothetical protein [Halomonas mongoliensis]
MNRHSRRGAGLLSALLLAGAALAETSHEADDEAMIDLAWDSGCFNCHDLDNTLRGPAWRDVAERYRDDDEALAQVLRRFTWIWPDRTGGPLGYQSGRSWR